MAEQVPGPVKRERTARLIALGERLSAAFHSRYEGTTRPVLWEGVLGAEPEGLRWAGHTDNYIRVTGIGPADLMRQITPALLSDPQPEGMGATLVARVS